MADVPVTEVVQVDAVLDALVDPTASQVYSAVEPFSNAAVAAAAAKRALSPSGGSQPVSIVRVPIAFDTPGLAVQSFPQVSADLATSSFVIAGNRTALFPPGGKLTSTSDNNSGAYTVASSSFGGGNTTIVVEESVADEGATGEIIDAASGVTGSGIEVYVPTPGDIWLPASSYVSVTTAWDGTGTPTAYLYEDGSTDYANSLDAVSGIDIGAADDDATVDATGAVVRPTLLAISLVALILTDATPLRLVIDDANSGAPGSTQGAGEIVLFIIQAAA